MYAELAIDCNPKRGGCPARAGQRCRDVNGNEIHAWHTPRRSEAGRHTDDDRAALKAFGLQLREVQTLARRGILPRYDEAVIRRSIAEILSRPPLPV